jgi:hypothetical protein
MALVAVALTAGGFWLGNVVSGGDAAAATRTIRLEGRVVTVAGTRYVSTPAQTVLVKGKRVRLPAQAVPISGHTAQPPGSTVVVSTTINGTSVATIVRTVTAPPVTVTAPASTVTGPTTTVQETITVPVVSTVTITVP